MSGTLRVLAIAVTSASLLLLAASAYLASSNGRWESVAGSTVLDTRTGRICGIDVDRRGYCDDYSRFRVVR